MPRKPVSRGHLRYPMAVALAAAIALPIAAAILVLSPLLTEPSTAGTGMNGFLLATPLGLNALLVAWLIRRLRRAHSVPIDSPPAGAGADAAQRAPSSTTRSMRRPIAWCSTCACRA